MSDNRGFQEPTEAELAAMSREERVTLGGKMDGVETVFKEPRWPIEGTKAVDRFCVRSPSASAFNAPPSALIADMRSVTSVANFTTL